MKTSLISCTLIQLLLITCVKTNGLSAVAVLVTVRSEVAKIMFLHVSVIMFTGGVSGQVPPWTRYPSPPPGIRYTPPRLGPGTPPGQGTPQTRYTPPDQVHEPGTGTPSGDRYCCRRYASYWNAFLFCCVFPSFFEKCLHFFAFHLKCNCK